MIGTAVRLLTGQWGAWILGAAAAVVALLLAAVGAQTFRLALAESERDKARLEVQSTLTKWNAQVAAGVRVAFAESEKNRAEESRRTAAQKEIVDEAQRLARRARDDAVAGVASHERLLDRAIAAGRAAGGGQGGGDSAAAGGGEAARGAGLVPSELLRRSDDRSGLLASYADEARTAGLACERAYDSLTAANWDPTLQQGRSEANAARSAQDQGRRHVREDVLRQDGAPAGGHR